jgi:WD40 repeat protein
LTGVVAAFCLAVMAGLAGISWQSAGRQRALTESRQIAYALEIRLAQHELEQNNLGRALELLDRHRPRPGGPDLRGWEWRYLWQQCRSDELSKLPEMKEDIQALTFSPDGKYLAVGTARPTLLLYDLSTNQKIAQVKLDRATPGRLTFSLNSGMLAVGNFQRGLELWDWKPPKLTPRGSPLLDEGSVGAMCFHPQTVLAVDVAARPCQLCCWDLSTGERRPLFPVVSTQEPDLTPWNAFSPDGRLLANSSNTVAIVWSIQTGAKLATVSGHDRGTEPLAFSPDSRWLALGSVNGRVTIWDVRSGHEVTNFVAHASDLERGEFTRDGKFLVTASYDHTLKLWDTRDWHLAGKLRGHRGEVYDMAVSPDGNLIASASADGTVRLWSAQPPQRPLISRNLPPEALSWSLSQDGQWLFLLFPNGYYRLWNLDTCQESPVQWLGATNITAVCLLQGGRTVCAGDSDGGVKWLDLSTAKPIKSFRGFDGGAVTAVNCSADDSTVVAQSAGHMIKVWNMTTGAKLQQLSWTNHFMWNRLPISPHGRRIVTSTLDGETDVWGVPGAQRWSLPLNEKLQVAAAAFFRDGHRLVTASLDKSARVWDLRRLKGPPLQTMYSDLTGLRSVALSPDEKRIAVGDDLGRPRKVKLFDANSGQEVAVLDGPQSSIVDLAFRRDGNTLVAMSADAVFVWRAPSWSEIGAREISSP